MPSDPSRPNRWWIAPVLGVVVVATAAAALVARNVYQQPTSVGGPIVSTSQPKVPANAEPGSPTVVVTLDVANNPVGTQVRKMVQTHFDAINTRNYDKWLTTVTASLANEEPRAAFASGYKTSKDGTIEIVRIDNAPNSSDLRVLLTFHSTQRPEDAPSFPHSCIVWQVVWPVVHDKSGALRHDSGVTGGSPQQTTC